MTGMHVPLMNKQAVFAMPLGGNEIVFIDL